jgi:hypothetical protein
MSARSAPKSGLGEPRSSPRLSERARQLRQAQLPRPVAGDNQWGIPLFAAGDIRSCRLVSYTDRHATGGRRIGQRCTSLWPTTGSRSCGPDLSRCQSVGDAVLADLPVPLVRHLAAASRCRHRSHDRLIHSRLLRLRRNSGQSDGRGVHARDVARPVARAVRRRLRRNTPQARLALVLLRGKPPIEQV